MVRIATGAAHPRHADHAGLPMLACLFAVVALLSVLQGVGEFTLPLLLGGEPFALTRGLAEHIGAAGLFAGILLHNLGLALLLPGCGLLAACHERDPRARRLVAPILLAALLGAVTVGIVTVVATAPADRVPLLLALAAGEATTIFVVALATARHLRFGNVGGDVPRWWPAHQALHQLRPTVTLALLALAALAAAETWMLHDAMG